MRIKLEHLARHYSDVHAVRDVSLEVPSNKIMGIIGKSGAGKSTLVRLVSLLEKPDRGEVWYDNDRVDNLDSDSLIKRRKQNGMIFQNFNLFSSRSAGQNVAYPMEISGYSKHKIRERVKFLLELVGLEDKIDAPISTLSGGQKQRIAIARALACEPKILFCDEATSALDPQTTRSILKLIKDIQQKMNLTVLMITHQMEVVRDCCDFVAVLNDGVIVEQGTVRDIFSHPKTAITKDFLANLAPSSNDKDSVVYIDGKGGRYILRFPAKSTEDPVLSRLSREYGIDFNVRGAGIQKVEGDSFGTLICDISGEETAVKNAISDLRRHRIIVEEAGV